MYFIIPNTEPVLVCAAMQGSEVLTVSIIGTDLTGAFDGFLDFEQSE